MPHTSKNVLVQCLRSYTAVVSCTMEGCYPPEDRENLPSQPALPRCSLGAGTAPGSCLRQKSVQMIQIWDQDSLLWEKRSEEQPALGRNVT